MKKEYTKTQKSCKVTFELANPGGAKEAFILGDFNDWTAEKHKMKKSKDGNFSLAVSLKPGSEYKYRYLLDGETWVNDPEADGYAPNTFGTQDSVVTI